MLALTGLTCLLSLLPSALGQGLTVTTKQGAVTGALVNSKVRQFLGVPFAVANRWEAPQAPPQRSATLSATKFGDACVQALTPGNLKFLELTGVPNITVPESEDCLSANIWAPSTSRKQSTAVMIWIYGGGFQFGTSNTVAYNGTTLVGNFDDVTIVSFNYRLNIFGLPNAPQLQGGTTSLNFALLDVEAAIKWVYDNIAAFGGDPGRITIFGESAGGVATDAYAFAHESDTIVKGIIQESGTLGINLPGDAGPSAGQLNKTVWNTVANTVGCGTNNDATQFQCMKAVPYRTLEDAVIKSNLNFGPVVDNITLVSDIAERGKSGKFLKVPLLTGNNAQEGDIFVVAAQLVANGTVDPILTPILSDLVTKAGFSCPAGVTADNRANAGVPTWRYRYDAIFPDISTRLDLRAYHASEIPLVFGTYNLVPTPPPTLTEIALSKYIQAAWVAFARDPAKGLTNYGWPKYDSVTLDLVVLGGVLNPIGASFISGTLYDVGCNITIPLPGL